MVLEFAAVVMVAVRAAPRCQKLSGASAAAMLSTLVPALVVQSIFHADCEPGAIGNWPPGAPHPFTALAGAANNTTTPAVATAAASRTEPSLGRCIYSPSFESIRGACHHDTSPVLSGARPQVRPKNAGRRELTSRAGNPRS